MGLRDRLHSRRILMILSVGEHEAGRTYRLPDDVADRYVARGYAAGSFSREYDPDEIQALKGNPQVVQL